MKSKLGMTLLWILVFLLGGIAGAISHHLYQAQAPTEASAKSKLTAQEIIEGMTKGMKLDAQQQEALKNIFDETRKRYRALNKQYRPEYLKVRDESDNKIRAMLHEDQKARFEERLKKYRPQPKPEK